jgi:sarcosine oxidase subunit gamma
MVEQGRSRRPPLPDNDAAGFAGIGPQVFSLRILPSRTRLSLRSKPSELPAGGHLAGFALGMSINRRFTSQQRSAARLGPDEWLLCLPETEPRNLTAEIGTVLAGRHHSIVDVSHRYVALAVSGARAADVLSAGCPLDLSPAAFPAGAATRTLLGKCEIILARIDDAPTFEIECGRSFAAYVRDFLLEASRELRAPA